MPKPYLFVYLILIVSVLSPLPVMGKSDAPPGSAEKSMEDKYMEEYRKEVRAHRPSPDYTVFEPAIVFFQNTYEFIKNLSLFLAGIISVVFDYFKSKLQSL